MKKIIVFASMVILMIGLTACAQPAASPAAASVLQSDKPIVTSPSVTEGYLIENGKITRPVKGATLSGMGIQNLKTIDMIGTDMEIFPSSGRCGKGQSAPTGFGMPTTRVRGILVGGKGEAWADVEGVT